MLPTKIAQVSRVLRVLPNLSSDSMKHCPIFYTGSIGKMKDYNSQIITTHKSQLDIIHACGEEDDIDIDLYKYGISTNIHRRIREHKRGFKRFDVRVIKESSRPQEVEYKITQELKSKHMLLRINMNNKSYREITFFMNEKEKEWYSEMVDYYVLSSRKDYSHFINISNL